jgi:DNA-binding protein H-NS
MWRVPLARQTDLERMSIAELADLGTHVSRLKLEKQNSERAAVRQQIAEMAKEHGFDIRDLIDGRRKGSGTVAVKYRDPKSPDNTWTGRGRMPRWLVAATKGGKARKEDFLL